MRLLEPVTTSVLAQRGKFGERAACPGDTPGLRWRLLGRQSCSNGGSRLSHRTPVLFLPQDGPFRPSERHRSTFVRSEEGLSSLIPPPVSGPKGRHQLICGGLADGE